MDPVALQDAIERTDGCALRGSPDPTGGGQIKQDYVTTCAEQGPLYTQLKSALDALSILDRGGVMNGPSIRVLRAIIFILPLLALGAPSPVAAQPVVLNFDTLARGTILRDQLQAQGILVTGLQGSGIGLVPGEVLDVVAGDQLVNDFGGSLPQAILYGTIGDQLTIHFVLPDGSPGVSDYVSLRVGDGDPRHESFVVSFRDINGTLLNEQQFMTFDGPVNGGVTVEFVGGGIHLVEIRGREEFVGSDGGTGGAIDDLTFNPVLPALCGLVDQVQAQLNQCRADLDTTRQSLTSCQASLESAEQRVSQLQAQVDQLQIQLANATADAAQFNAALSADVLALQNHFRQTFSDPAFVVPGGTPLEQIHAVVQALLGVNNGRQLGVYESLRGVP